MQFITSIPAWAWLLISSLFFACGEYLSKRYALAPSLPLALLTLTAYTSSSAMWLPAILETNRLAITGTIWLLLGLGVTLSVGLIVYGEHISMLQWIGLGFAVVAVTLLSL